jgi:hypothetical protein
VGDAKLVLRQFIDACKDLLKGKAREGKAVQGEIWSLRASVAREVVAEDRPGRRPSTRIA